MFTRSASKAAIPRAIPSVFRERALAVADAVRARRFSRDQSSDGVVVRCWTGVAGTETAAVLRALPPIALGHALSIGIIIAAVLLARISLPQFALKITAAAILFAFGLYRLFRSRHPNWVGMRVGFGDLTLWSFVMASAHGAGLMLIPLFLKSPPPDACAARGRNGHAHAPDPRPRIR